MRWIFDHLEIVAAIAAAIAYWLNQRKSQRDEADEHAPRGSQTASSPHDDADRTRRIQEEIRRKIAERRSGGAPPPPLPAPAPARTAPPPLQTPRPAMQDSSGLHDTLARKLAELRQRAEAAEAGRIRQQQLDAQMRAEDAERIEEERRSAALAAAKAEALYKASQVQAQESAQREAQSWIHALRDPQLARRAIVLRELLGAPVGLRRADERSF